MYNERIKTVSATFIWKKTSSGAVVTTDRKLQRLRRMIIFNAIFFRRQVNVYTYPHRPRLVCRYSFHNCCLHYIGILQDYGHQYWLLPKPRRDVG